MSAKLVLAKMPIPYSAWSRLNLFRHGRMDSSDYAVACFDTHWRAWGGATSPATVLEIGPGDSVSTAFIARARGVSKTYLVDAAPFAHQRIEDYRALISHLEPGEKSAELRAAPTFEELLRRANCDYLTQGVKSLASIPDASVDLLYSHATLEHIPADDLAELMHQTRRILKPGGVISHQIDLRDHLGGGLNNLRFSRGFWETDWVRNSGFYTNRARLSVFLRLFAEARLTVRKLDSRKWPQLPIDRAKLDPAFRELTDEDLSISGVLVILEPAV